MTKKQFLKQYRSEIDLLIVEAVGKDNARLNDHERELWVCNDEYLYNMARRKGVRI